MKFSSQFQNAVIYSDAQEMHINDLLSAFENVSTAQVDVIPARAERILKSLVKDKQLYIRPTVAVFDDKAYLVSGRHRAVGIQEFCANYGLNAAGQVTKYTGDINDNTLEPIEPIVLVEVIHATNLQVVGHLQLEYNGSRSMTAAETNLVKSTFAKLTALAKVQMSFATKLSNSIDVTFNTALSIAKKVSAAFPKKFVYSTEDQLNVLVSWMVDFHGENEGNEDIVPSNMARSYAKFVGAFLKYEVSTGEVDEDDQDYVDTVVNLYGAGLEKPEAATKKNSKVSELQAQIEALTAKLQASGLA